MVISVEAINVNGIILPPMFILFANIHQKKWYITNLPPNYLISISESSYINDDLNFEFIRYFNRNTKAKTKGVYRLFIGDGYNSYLEFDFI